MNLLKSIVAVSFIFSSATAFANHHDENGPCKAYWTSDTCKAAKDKAAKMACVKSAAEADATNGPACTAAMKAHHDKKEAAKGAPAKTN